MFKITEHRLEPEPKQLPDVQARFWKGRGIRDITTDVHCSAEKAKESKKEVNMTFTEHSKVFDWIENGQTGSTLAKKLDKAALQHHLLSAENLEDLI